jgi:hypothetical protein
MGSVHQRASNDNGRAELISDLAARMARAASFVLPRVDFEDLERVLLEASNEAVRQMLERDLQRIADSFGDVVEVRGRLYRRHQPGTVKYFSLCGPLEVTRFTYRLAEKRNGPTCVPLERAAGLALGATPAFAYSLAQGHAKAPIRSVEQDLLAAHRRPPSRSTMDRIARHLGALANHYVDEFEPVLRAGEQLPEGAFAINLGLDRTSIPMEEPADGEPSKSGYVVRYRMGYVGTVCITNAACEELVTRRYAAAAHEDPERLIERMMADMERALEQNPKLNIGIVQDNAPELWNRMREAMRARLPEGRWRETVDRYHLMARLAAALEVMYPRQKDEPVRRQLYATWSKEIDRRDNAVKKIVRGVMRELWNRPGREWLKVNALIGKYINCEKHFRYASLKRLGLYSGSGVTEGACKSLIASRAKRSGQRWRMVGISSVLALRTLLDSDRLARFWPYFARQFHAECKTASIAA